MGLSRRGNVAHLTTQLAWRDSAPHLTRPDGIKKLLDLKAGVLDVCAGYDFDSPDTDGVLPSSVKSSAAAFGHGRRTLVYQVIHEIRPLWLLESAEEFKKCYDDLLRAHFHAHNLGRVLHRDISEISALTRPGADGKVAGLLSDWDLSCLVDEVGLGKPSAPQPRSGTTLFMAIDLQRQTVGNSAAAYHRYCHDLESFFWLLIWAVVHFDLTNKRCLNCIDVQWARSWKNSVRFKRDLLNNGDALDQVLDNALDMWEDVVDRWVRPLARKLDNARQGAMRWDDNDSKVFDDDAYAKGLTFEALMHTIRVTPREWSHEKEA